MSTDRIRAALAAEPVAVQRTDLAPLQAAPLATATQSQ